MSCEALETIKKYFGLSACNMNYHGNVNSANEIANYFSYGKFYNSDAPDIAIIYSNQCLAVEHFEFDSYKNNKHGSQNRIEQARIERDFNKVPLKINRTISHDEIKGVSSYAQYISNVSSVFNNHYERIADYKKNLNNKSIVSPCIPIKIAFLIEDISPLGTIVNDGDKTYPVILAKCPEFLALMKKSPDVDYVIACSQLESNKYVWLISKDQLDEYCENAIDYKSMEFIAFIPKVLSFKIHIPNKPEK